MKKRLVLMVEGESDAAAVPCLVAHCLNRMGGEDVLFVDHRRIIRGATLSTLIGRRDAPALEWWCRQLGNALNGRDVGAVMLVTDGDVGRIDHPEYRRCIGGDAFCAAGTARWLVQAAAAMGAGERFSVSVAIALCEYEAWLMGGVEGFEGAMVGRSASIRAKAAVCPAEPERIRDAKGAMRGLLGDYWAPGDALRLTRRLDVAAAAQRCRSLRRLVHAVEELVVAHREGRHVVSPR